MECLIGQTKKKNFLFGIFQLFVTKLNRNTGFYDDFEPLNDEDISYIIEEMKILELDEKYSKEKWELN